MDGAYRYWLLLPRHGGPARMGGVIDDGDVMWVKVLMSRFPLDKPPRPCSLVVAFVGLCWVLVTRSNRGPCVEVRGAFNHHQ